MRSGLTSLVRSFYLYREILFILNAPHRITEGGRPLRRCGEARPSRGECPCRQKRGSDIRHEEPAVRTQSARRVLQVSGRWGEAFLPPCAKMPQARRIRKEPPRPGVPCGFFFWYFSSKKRRKVRPSEQNLILTHPNKN